jgi:hypothetical protein
MRNRCHADKGIMRRHRRARAQEEQNPPRCQREPGLGPPRCQHPGQTPDPPRCRAQTGPTTLPTREPRPGPSRLPCGRATVRTTSWISYSRCSMSVAASYVPKAQDPSFCHSRDWPAIDCRTGSASPQRPPDVQLCDLTKLCVTGSGMLPCGPPCPNSRAFAG